MFLSQVHREVIPTHTVYALNIERVIMKLWHPNHEELQQDKVHSPLGSQGGAFVLLNQDLDGVGPSATSLIIGLNVLVILVFQDLSV